MMAIQPSGAANVPGISSADPFAGPSIGERDPKKASVEFAGFFYSMMLKEMEKGIPKNDYFGGKGEETFRSLWVGEMGRMMAAREGDPLAGAILKDIEKQAASAAHGGRAK